MLTSSLSEEAFFGRQDELSSLYKRALRAEQGASRSVVLAGPRGIGKTEILRHLFGRLFWTQERVFPFLFTFNPALLSVAAFSKAYLSAFLCQRLAFEKREQALLYRDGISIDALSGLIEEREVAWAREILFQFLQCSRDPVEALRIALAAPHRSMLSTKIPVAVLIDDFHLVGRLHMDGVPDHRLSHLFEEPLGHGKTPHMITGNMAELQEMLVTSGLERFPVRPLGLEGTSSLAQYVMKRCETEGNVPPLLLRRLDGNPFYLERVLARAGEKNHPVEQDFWNAYLREITDGALSLYWKKVFKSFFPDLGLRRVALETIHKINHASEDLPVQRIVKSFARTDSQAQDIVHNLYFAGFISGEFGAFRKVEDAVLRDLIDCLYQREILEKAAREVERDILESIIARREQAVRFELVLPMAREAELVAAQSLEQIGKNLNLSQETVGQMQIAVIEACINALEHSGGMGDQVYVSIAVDEDQLEVSVESAGREFIMQETGEPFRDQEAVKASGRGWGIKLIKRFVDQVTFEKTARGTKIVLIKKLERPAGIQKEDIVNRE